jgi:hypothetical protein
MAAQTANRRPIKNFITRCHEDLGRERAVSSKEGGPFFCILADGFCSGADVSWWKRHCES